MPCLGPPHLSSSGMRKHTALEESKTLLYYIYSLICKRPLASSFNYSQKCFRVRLHPQHQGCGGPERHVRSGGTLPQSPPPAHPHPRQVRPQGGGGTCGARGTTAASNAPSHLALMDFARVSDLSAARSALSR